MLFDVRSENQAAPNYSNMSSPVSSIVVTVLYFFSLICGLLAAITGYRVARFISTSVRCKGKVSKLVKESHGFHSLFRPNFTFTDENGKKQTISSSIASYPAPFAVGETIELIYPPGRPFMAQYRGFFAQWGLTVFLTAFATITYCVTDNLPGGAQSHNPIVRLAQEIEQLMDSNPH